MATKLLTVKEMRAKKPIDLSKYVAELTSERIQLLQDIQSGKAETTHKLSQIKRSIASAHTIMKEVQMNAPEKEETK